jgi:hypothetical protein
MRINSNYNLHECLPARTAKFTLQKNISAGLFRRDAVTNALLSSINTLLYNTPPLLSLAGKYNLKLGKIGAWRVAGIPKI